LPQLLYFPISYFFQGITMNVEPHFSSPRNNRAIVIGSSITGLLTARILTHHFDRVTLIERDRLPDDPTPRPGVPQTIHVHALLDRGRAILEELFPGFQHEIAAGGAHLLDMAADVAWLTPAGWGLRFPSDLKMISCTRSLLEWTIRRRLKAFPQIEFLPETQVKELIPNADNTRITGILIRERDRVEPVAISADLVVDASGRNSQAPNWLEWLGYLPPQETVVNARIGYASRLFQRPSGFSADWQGLYLQAAPPVRPRACIIFPVEGDRWLVTLTGEDGQYPPTEDTGFLEFTRCFPTLQAYNALKTAEPLSPIFGYRATQSRWRHYERLSRWPEGFVILGDAVCAFNPVYGQGMTAAALSALLLDRALSEQPEGTCQGFSLRFQKQLAKLNAPLWQLATSEDCRYRTVVGASPNWGTRLMHRYMDRVLMLTTENASVRRTLIDVFNLVKPPTALFHPSIVARVLARSLSRTSSFQLEPPELIATLNSLIDESLVSDLERSANL
jgi:2-polyprenyl-6-methoxyphenol hydroxylase-like FAD-dependent oxidoreductase